MKRQYLIIAADFWTDMGKQFVCFTLLDLLVFHSNNPLTSLVLISLIQHGPSIFLSFGLPLLFKQRLGGDISQWGVIISAFQAGSFLATLLLPRLLFAVRLKAMQSLGFLALGAAMLALSLVTNYIQAALLMVVVGCGFTMFHIFWESLIQQTSPKQHMGKIMSLLSSYKGLCYLSAILSGALVVKLWTPQSLLLLGALLMGSAALPANR